MVFDLAISKDGFVPVVLPTVLAFVAPLIAIKIIKQVKNEKYLTVARFFLGAFFILLGTFIGIKIHLAIFTENWGFEFFATPFLVALALVVNYFIVKVKAGSSGV